MSVREDRRRNLKFIHFIFNSLIVCQKENLFQILRNKSYDFSWVGLGEKQGV